MSGEPAFADRLVVRDYEAAYTEAAFRGAAGEAVERIKADDDWPGWIWCRTADGRKGWIHEDFLRSSGEGWELAEDYDARELTVRAGQTVTVLRELGGWARVRTESGREGWVPGEVLDVPPARCRPS